MADLEAGTGTVVEVNRSEEADTRRVLIDQDSSQPDQRQQDIDQHPSNAAPETHPRCHEKSTGDSANPKDWEEKSLVRFWSWRRGQRLVPPRCRHHTPVIYTEGSDVFSILRKECMEQLYDDNIHGNFGTVDFLSFNRLHHFNLHYFETELATKLVDVVDGEVKTEDGIVKIRKLLRGYSQFP